MLSREIKLKIQKDLNIAEHRARRYTELFLKKYTGQKAAIRDVFASYTDDGDVMVTYLINKKKNHIIIDEKFIYADIVARAREKKLQNQQK